MEMLSKLGLTGIGAILLIVGFLLFLMGAETVSAGIGLVGFALILPFLLKIFS